MNSDSSSSVLPQWSPESAIDLMDSLEIAIGILSLTAPGIVGWDKSERRDMARRVNEYTADLRGAVGVWNCKSSDRIKGCDGACIHAVSFPAGAGG